MKISKVVVLAVVIIAPVVIAAGIFFFQAKSEPELAFRSDLTNAQKILVMLRRAEMAVLQTTKSYKAISAKKIDGKMIYSAGWSEMKLPNVAASSGFDYECLPAEGVCQAIETGKMGPTGNGIRIDIGTGAYACMGAYQPVKTEGFNGAPVVVACQAS
jgi:hypothetical protein